MKAIKNGIKSGFVNKRPVFRPSWDEFANFKDYIKKLEAIEPKISFAKVSVFVYNHEYNAI